MDVSRPTIVIVEDEEAISLFWGDCLREAGFDVQAFSDATGYDERRYPGACAADPLLCILGKPFEEPYVPAGVAH